MESILIDNKRWDLEDLESNLGELQSDLEDKLNTVSYLVGITAKLNEKYTTYTKELEEKIKDLESEVKELNQENTNLDDMNEKLKDEIMELNYKLEDLEE